MKATETYLILCQMDAGEITLQEAHELILRLFGVSGELAVDECKCIRFTSGDKWYANGCKIHPNG